jgi:site-specific DNA recombinase
MAPSAAAYTSTAALKAAYIGRVYYNRTDTVPDRRPGRRSRQVPCLRADWIAISCPAIITEDTFQAAATVSYDNA